MVKFIGVFNCVCPYCVIVSVCSIVNIPGMAEMMDYIVSMVPRLIAGLMYPCSLQINAKNVIKNLLKPSKVHNKRGQE